MAIRTLKINLAGKSSLRFESFNFIFPLYRERHVSILASILTVFDNRGLDFHTYVGSGHFFWGGSKFEFQFLGVFRKMYFLGGMKILWTWFWCHHKIGLYLGVISMHFRVFSEVQGTEWDIFWGC